MFHNIFKFHSPEHDSETARQALCFLFQKIRLGIANESTLPQHCSLLTVSVEVPRESVSLDQTVEQRVEVMQGQAGVHAPLLPPLTHLAGVDVVVLRPGQGLRVLPLAGGGVEHDVVDGLDQLQLHNTLNSQHREQFLLFSNIGRFLVLLTRSVTVVTRWRISNISINLQQQRWINTGGSGGV